MTKRIQLKRTRGWRLPENAISVARPGRWGNPFKIGADVDDVPYWIVKQAGHSIFSLAAGAKITRELAIAFFRVWAIKNLDLTPLRDKDYLACWCRLDESCHADVIIELLNEKKSS